MSSEISLIVKTIDPDSVLKLFENGNEKSLEGVNGKIVSQRRNPGALEHEFFFEILVNICVGTSASLLASWIYNKLLKKGENTMSINNTFVYTKQDIIIQLKQEIKSDTANQMDDVE